MILDSGARREFESGAVRDIQEGKGRCDLLPLIEVSLVIDDPVIFAIGKGNFQTALKLFAKEHNWDKSTMILEVAKHFEEGAKKYEERNWELGINTHCFIDSAVRHYLKFKRGDDDERHDRAFVWNLLCYMWTVENRPELDDYKR